MTAFSPAELLGMPRPFDFPESPGSADPALAREGLHPPLPVLVSRTPEKPRRFLVWGRAVAGAARDGNAAAVPVREIDEAELPPREAFILCLRLENRRDRYSPREMETLAAVMEDLGIPDTDPVAGGLVSSRGALRQAARRTRLRPAARELASEEKIDIKTAEGLDGVPDGVLLRLRPALDGMSFSGRRMFLVSLNEVLLRDAPGDPEELAERLAAADNPSEVLREIRFPELSGMERRFREITGRFFTGSGIVVKHPPFFEGRRFSAAFEFESPAVLRKKLKVLEKFLREGDELYDLL